jgi:hypothetical protein
MFNPIQFYEFGKSRGGIPNTFIGGVSASIGTAALLATKLAINVSRITNFSVVGSDIECNVRGNYSGIESGFDVNTQITYYNDNDGLIVNIARRFIRNCSNLLWVNFPKLETASDEMFVNCPLIKKINLPSLLYSTGAYQSFSSNNLIEEINLPKLLTVQNSSFSSNPNIKVIYIPSCNQLGADVSGNGLFGNLSNFNKLRIYCNPFLQTSNNGGVDGDLIQAMSIGAIIRYVTNYTKPNAVVNLTSGTVYDTAIQLNFTPPSSTNAIDYYDCYANGIFKNNIIASGGYITGLAANTAYEITVISVDVFYNKSVVSNSVSGSTNTTEFPFTGLVSYYKLDSNSIDSYDINNGADTSVTYGVGKIGNGALFNSNSAIININSFSGITTKASISFWIKININTPTDSVLTGLMSLNTTDQNTHYPFSDGNIYMSLLTSVRKSIGVGIIGDRTAWHMVTVTANSTTNVWKFYQNGTLVTTSTVGSLTMLSSICLGKSRNLYYLKGSLDEVSIYNTDLTQSQITQIYNNGNGITL